MPISCLTFSPPSFNQFILAAHEAEPEDHLIFDDGTVSSVSKAPDAEMNKRTWEAFERAVKGAFSQEKIDWICRRYYKKNWDQLSSDPFKRGDVERFGVGACSATVSDLQYAQSWWKSKSLSSRSVEGIKHLYDRATSHRYLVDKQDPRKISGSPREAHEHFIFDPFKMDQQRCNLFMGIPKLISNDPNIPKMHPYYSRLSMAITCLFENPSKAKDPEFVIPAPGVREGEIDFYKVYKIVSGKGLTAVALAPISDRSSLQPIISFRCTKQAPWQEGFFQSVLTNGEKQMGKSGYAFCKNPLRQLLEDKEFSKGKKIKVLAYSQGGAYAGHFLKNSIGEFWRKIDEFIGFNFIGNDDPKASEEMADNKVIEGIADQINALAEDEIPPSFTIHRNIGDWVNGSGKRHVGWGIHHPKSSVRVFEWNINDYPMPEKNPRDQTQRNLWFNLHGARPMDSSSTYTYDLYQGPTQCDPILDTYKRDPTLEDIRQEFGHEVIHRIGTTLLHLLDFLVRIFGIEFLKKYFKSD